MQASLRKILIDSHVAAATIAILIFLSLQGFYIAALQIVTRAVLFLQSAANHQGATRPPALDSTASMLVFIQGLLAAATILCSAWVLSSWVYGMNPMRSLATCRNKLPRRFHA